MSKLRLTATRSKIFCWLLICFYFSTSNYFTSFWLQSYTVSSCKSFFLFMKLYFYICFHEKRDVDQTCNRYVTLYLICQYVKGEFYSIFSCNISSVNQYDWNWKVSKFSPIIHQQSEMSEVQFLHCFFDTLKIQQIRYA